jgi:hypothetical protein
VLTTAVVLAIVCLFSRIAVLWILIGEGVAALNAT